MVHSQQGKSSQGRAAAAPNLVEFLGSLFTSLSQCKTVESTTREFVEALKAQAQADVIVVVRTDEGTVSVGTGPSADRISSGLASGADEAAHPESEAYWVRTEGDTSHARLQAALNREGYHSALVAPFGIRDRVSGFAVALFAGSIAEPESYEQTMSLAALQLGLHLQNQMLAERLEVQTANLDSLLAARGFGLVVFDSEARIVGFNEVIRSVAKDLFGMSVEIGHSIDRIPSEEILARVRERFSRAFAGEITSYRTTYQPLVGEPREFESTYAPIRKKDGACVGVTLSVVETTGARHAAQQAEEFRARLETIFQHLQSVVVYDAMRGKSYVSPNIEQILGYPAKEFEENPKRFSQLVDQRVWKQKSAQIKAWLESDSETNLEMEFQVKSKDGREVHLIDHMIKARDESGHPYVRGIMIDVTTHKAMQAKLAEAQRMEAIGRLAGGVAHDFNNLLTAMVGFSEIALMKVGENESLRSDLEKVLTAAERAARLTQQLLAFAKQQVNTPAPICPNEVIRQLEPTLLRVLGEHHKLRLHLAQNLWQVRLDPIQVEQMLLNLVVNARDAMREGGDVVICTENQRFDELEAASRSVPPGEYVQIAVSDAGSGIAEEVRRRMFEPFFTTKPPGSGTGLGLSICYGIATQAGGSISAETSEGFRTSIRVILPRAMQGRQTRRRTKHSIERPGQGQAGPKPK